MLFESGRFIHRIECHPCPHWLYSALYNSMNYSNEASIHWRFSLVCIGSSSDTLDPLVCIKCAIHASAAQCNTSLLLLLFPGIWPQVSLLSCQCSVLTKCKYYKQKLIVVLWCHALSTLVLTLSHHIKHWYKTVLLQQFLACARTDKCHIKAKDEKIITLLCTV